MTTSDHARTPLARLALAAGGVGVLLALAAAMRYAAGSIGGARGARGTLAAVLLAAAVSGGCRLAHSLRSRRAPGLTRPGPVRLPDRAAADLEPAA